MKKLTYIKYLCYTYKHLYNICSLFHIYIHSCFVFVTYSYLLNLYQDSLIMHTKKLNFVSIIMCDLRCVFDSTFLSFQLVLLRISSLQKCMPDQFTCSFQGFSYPVDPSFHMSFAMTDTITVTCHKLILKIQIQGLTFVY